MGLIRTWGEMRSMCSNGKNTTFSDDMGRGHDPAHNSLIARARGRARMRVWSGKIPPPEGSPPK